MVKRLCARAPEQSGGRVDIVASGEVLFDSGGYLGRFVQTAGSYKPDPSAL